MPMIDTRDNSNITNFNCGICMSDVDITSHPAPSSYATFMPCCNFPIHLRCAKLSFNHLIWACPSCRAEDSLITEDSKARFITYLYLRSNFIPDQDGSLESNIQAIKSVFQIAFCTPLAESKPVDETLLFVKPIDNEPIETLRKRFISFYDDQVLSKTDLKIKLSLFFDEIFAVADSTSPIEMMDTFIELEGINTVQREPSRLFKRISTCIICVMILGLSISIIVLVINKYAK